VMFEPRRSDEVEIASERGFGLVFAGFFGAVGLWPIVHGHSPRLWACAAAILCLGLTLLWPRVLRPFNLLWFRLGLLLGAVVTPVVMGLLYVTAIVPTGIFMRYKGRDPLSLRREPDRASYWIVRDTPGPAPGTMKRQF
jgi:Saxitoxin biosynthesis operon protein SxtJ